jgi:ribonuclease-3
MMNPAIKSLEHILGYHFKNPNLLSLALTHRSANTEHNERLEFIGDSIVNLIIGEALYHAHPCAPEGELSRWRAALVQRETLAELAKEWKLEQKIIIGAGELKTGGQYRASTLSNAVEAIIGALYFDAGFETTKSIVLRSFSVRLSRASIQNIQKDAKTLLQEFLQSRHHPLPNYELVKTIGEAHESTFEIACKLSHLKKMTLGHGTSKRKAEQDAAQKMLDLLQHPL